MPDDTTPPRKTAEDILDSSLRGALVTPEHQELLQAKAEELIALQNQHQPLGAENPYTKSHVIGETHSHAAPKRYLMEQMQNYAAAGYKTLFVEHLLYDEHQSDLNAFHRTGTIPTQLAEYLASQNAGQMEEKDDGTHNYTGVLKAAQTHGIRVVAIDTSLSYSFPSGKPRALAFSLTAAEIISREAGTDKWVAFMGNGHNYAQGFEDGSSVPGIANLFSNTIAVNIFDKDRTTDEAIVLTVQRNATRRIGDKTVYADIEITADPTAPLHHLWREEAAAIQQTAGSIPTSPQLAESPQQSPERMGWVESTQSSPGTPPKDQTPLSERPQNEDNPHRKALKRRNSISDDITRSLF